MLPVKKMLGHSKITRRPYLFCVKRYQYIKRHGAFVRACKKNAIEDNLILFEAYQGRQFDGNLRALYEELMADKNYSAYQCCWVVTDLDQFEWLSKKERTTLAKKGTVQEYEAYARAKYWFNNVALPDYLDPGNDHIYVETWHGTPLKKLGNDIRYDVDPRQSLREMHHKYKVKGRKIGHLVSPSRFYSDKLTSAFRLEESHKGEQIIWETGYPRNDSLFTYTDDDVKRLKEKIGIAQDKKVILYTPTWRDNHFHDDEKFTKIEAFDYKQLCQQLGPDYCLLIRYHHQIDVGEQNSDDNVIIDVSHYGSINELYIVSDLMITDYSSTMFDYANLKRPMLFYMYDLDEYEGEVRGFYMDVQKELPGPIVMQENELVETIKKLINDFNYETDEKYKRFNKTYNYLDGPDCAAKVLAKTFELK